MNAQEIREKLKKFIESNYLLSFGVDIQEDGNLFKEGFIDSFGYVELVSFLENEFSFEISEDEMNSGSLSSFNNINVFVLSKLAKK
jgi:D-alanine--poly(phosphoribitol) ligase subunit 2